MDLLACEHCQDMPKELGVSENGLYTPARAILIGKLMIMMIQWMGSGFLFLFVKMGSPIFQTELSAPNGFFPLRHHPADAWQINLAVGSTPGSQKMIRDGQDLAMKSMGCFMGDRYITIYTYITWYNQNQVTNLYIYTYALLMYGVGDGDEEDDNDDASRDGDGGGMWWQGWRWPWQFTQLQVQMDY